jgi:small subunit ribosomal protein S1
MITMPGPDAAAQDFLRTLRPGDRCGGIVADDGRQGVSVVLDGFPARPLGVVGPLDRSWRDPRAPIEPGRRITAVVLSVDPEGGRAALSLAATEHPELWAFLDGLRPGQRLSGAVAAIERFGVFVDLDDGPRHPVHPGVGFITVPELSWHRLDAPSDAVRAGQRVTCAFLQFDTSNGEARLSLRATRPDPFPAFARDHRAGDVLDGTVTKVVPFGVFVRVAAGVEGLLRDVPDGGVQAGEVISVAVGEIDAERRRVAFSNRDRGGRS